MISEQWRASEDMGLPFPRGSTPALPVLPPRGRMSLAIKCGQEMEVGILKSFESGLWEMELESRDAEKRAAEM